MTPPTKSSGDVRASERRVGLTEVISRHRLLLVVGVTVGLAVGVAVHSHLPPAYQSTAQVLVWQKRPEVILTVDPRHGPLEDTLSTQQELLKSTAILDRAVREHGLEGLASLQSETESTAEAVHKGLTVSRGKVAGGVNSVLQVSYRGPVADECPTVLAAVLQSYKQFLDGKFQTFAGDTLELVLRERRELEQELASKEASYRQFLETTPLVLRKPDGADLNRDRLASIQARRSAFLLRREELQGQLDRIESALRQGTEREAVLALIAEFSRGAELPEVAKTVTAAPPDQLTPLLLEEQKLLERYGPDHPEVRSARRRIDIARRVLVVPAAAWEDGRVRGGEGGDAEPVRRHLHILRLKLQHAAEAEERMRRLLEGEHEEARKLARYEIQDESFRTSITLTRQSYEVLNKRLQEAQLLKNGAGYDVEIITPPSTARKVAPSLTLVLPVAATLALFASLGLAYLAEKTGRRHRSPEDLQRRFGLPVLGRVPLFRVDVGRPETPGRIDFRLRTLSSPRSEEAEAYRRLRNVLLFPRGGAGRKVLQVTSAGRGEGKSVLAANLAVSLAQGDKRVVLVEADLHHPRLAEVFRQAPPGGLAQVLAGTRELKDVLVEGGVPGLSVLFAGPAPPDPADLLSSARFQDVLARLRDGYDFVLLDTPALLATTESAGVAARADGVLLAVHLTRSSSADLERSLEVLTAVGADVLGVVVNGVPGRARPAASFRWGKTSTDGRGGTDAQVVSNGSGAATEE